MDDVLTKCFDPFEKGLLSDSANLAAFCLDVIQKAVSEYSFSGRLFDPKNRQRLFIDYLVMVVAKCYEKFFSSSAVEIHMMKLLVILVTSPCSRVHGDSLISSIRICYNIFGRTSTPDNRQFAKSSLLMIIGTIYGRANALPNAVLRSYLLPEESVASSSTTKSKAQHSGAAESGATQETAGSRILKNGRTKIAGWPLYQKKFYFKAFTSEVNQH